MPPGGDITGGLSTERPGMLVIQSFSSLHALLVNGFARQRRHFDVTRSVHAHVSDRAPYIMWRNHSRPVDPFIDEYGRINESLALERSVVARIEVSDRASGAVTLRAICVEIGSSAVVQSA